MLSPTHPTPVSSRRLSTLALSALFLATAMPSQAALNINFDTPGQLTDYFANASPTAVGQSATGGLGGSGSINLTTLNFESQYISLKTAFAGNLANWSVSVFAYSGSTATAPVTMMGISSGPVRDFEGSPSINGTSIAPFLAFSSGEADGGSISTMSHLGGPGLADSHTVEMNANLAAATWYRHDLSVSYLGSNNYSLTASIYQVDANGANPVLRGTTGAQQYSNPVFAADPDVYLFLGFYNGAALDNFSTTAIPEPSSIALALGGCALVFRRRRARRD